MGGCATKPVVLKEEGVAPKTTEDADTATAAAGSGGCAVDDAAKDVTGGEESKVEAVEGRKSLAAEKEAKEEKIEEENEEAKAEQQVEEKPIAADEQRK